LKKIIALLSFFVLAGNVLFAQDDELPPPSSKPNQTEEKRNDQKPPDVKDFKGFSKPKKFDMSKLLIEPIVNLSISQYRTDIGFSPSVAYRVWQPKNAKAKSGNIGLFVGGGVTYSYTHINETANLKYNIQTYGAGPLIHYTIWRGLFVRLKAELLGRKIPVSYYTIPNGSGGIKYEVKYVNKFTPACLLGAGYNLLQSKNIFIPLIVSYDLLHSVVDKNYSIYPRGFTVQLGFITLF
jgi:hypothetical protein